MNIVETNITLNNDLNLALEVLKQIPLPISVIDKNYKYLFFNEAYQKIFDIDAKCIGSPIEEARGRKNFNDLIKPRFDKCLRGREVDYEYWHVNNDNAILLRVHYSPLKDSDGKVIGVISKIYDITSQHNYENQLIRNFSSFNKSLDSVDEMIMISNRDNVIEYCNKNLEKLVGLPLSEIVGKKCYKILKGKDSKCDICQHKTKDTTSLFDTELHGRKYKIKTEFVYDFDGNVAKFIDTFKDVTDSIYLRQSLIKNENRLFRLTSNIPDVVYVLKKEKSGEIVIDYINKVVEDLYGWKVGKNVDLENLYNNLFYDEDKYIIESIFETGISKDITYKLRFETADKKVIWTEHKFSFDKDEFGNPEVEAIVRNIDDQLRSEERLIKINRELEIEKEKAQESDKVKTEFLSIISHELRTPLNSIIGFASLLDSSLSDEDLDDFKKIIYTNGKSLLGIINSILRFVEILNNKLKVDFSHFNINDLMEDLKVFGINEVNIQNKHEIELELSKDKSLSNPFVYTDYKVINEVFTNLIRNAIKFTLSGKVEFGYKIFDNSSLVFFVSDTGIGIPPDKQNNIFEAFKQNESYNIRQFGGVGIGLSIAKKLIDLINGRIWFESKQGEGTSFYFTVSNDDILIYEDEYEKTFEINPDNQISFDNKTILIVEDELSTGLFMRSILNSYNARTILVPDGSEAVEVVESQNVDFVIMDIGLTNMDGITAFRIIKKFKPNIKIIACTGIPKEFHNENLIEIGFDAVILKPVDRNILISTVAKYIQ